MRIAEILFESKSADLYHGTTLSGAEQIVQSNKLAATTPIHSTTIPSNVKGYTRTVSLTRNPTIAGKFTRGDYGSGAGAILVIDQAGLARDLGKRLQSYDDTDTQWYKDNMKRWGNTPPDKSYRSMNRSESEETVFGDIENANKYIKKIILTTWDSHDENSIRRMDAIKKSPLINDPRTIVSTDGRATIMTPREFMQLYNKPAPGIE